MQGQISFLYHLQAISHLPYKISLGGVLNYFNKQAEVIVLFVVLYKIR